MRTFPAVVSPPPLRRTRRRLTEDDVLRAIGAGALAVSVWPTYVWMRGARPLQLAPLVAHVCGMLAGYGVIVLLGLMARAPTLERAVGSDVLARWHARGGRLVVILAVVHAWAAVVGWAHAQHEGVVSALTDALGWPGLVGATIGTVLLVAVGVTSMRAARRRMPYERWHAIHLLTYVAVALSFLHQLAGPDMAGRRIVQVAWALLYAHVFGLLVRYRVLAPLRQAVRHRLRVAAVIPEGDGVVSIEIEGEHLRELDAEAGQFFRWRFLTPDHWITAHPFSLSAPPTDRHLRLTVKSLGEGTTRLQHLPPGTWIVAEGPYGAMTAARRTQHDVLLIAGGVGITPMRALFETIPMAPGQDLTLLYRAHDAAHILFRRELDDIARRRRAHVHYLLGSSRDCLSARNLARLVPRLATRDVYLCGPPAMSAAVRRSLAEAGLTPSLLHEERFAW